MAPVIYARSALIFIPILLSLALLNPLGERKEVPGNVYSIKVSPFHPGGARAGIFVCPFRLMWWTSTKGSHPAVCRRAYRKERERKRNCMHYSARVFLSTPKVAGYAITARKGRLLWNTLFFFLIVSFQSNLMAAVAHYFATITFSRNILSSPLYCRCIKLRETCMRHWWSFVKVTIHHRRKEREEKKSWDKMAP